MYAVLRTGGKQYRVELGSEIDVERLQGEVGENLGFSDILFVGDADKIIVGKPNVEGVSVQAEILAQKKGKKLLIFKKRRRQGKQLKKGHRQQLTRVRIKEFTGIDRITEAGHGS